MLYYLIPSVCFNACGGLQQHEVTLHPGLTPLPLSLLCLSTPVGLAEAFLQVLLVK